MHMYIYKHIHKYISISSHIIVRYLCVYTYIHINLLFNSIHIDIILQLFNNNTEQNMERNRLRRIKQYIQ